jgi:hypothetical protein
MSATVRRAALALVAVVSALASGSLAPAGDRPLPRFTEEREAAAVHFVKKHCPELMPLLEDLQKNHRDQYEHEIREIFDVTEMLADLMDEPRRHDLELKIWITENKAYALVGKLSAQKEEDRKRTEEQLRGLARELVELGIRSMEMQADDLERDLGAVREDLAKARENFDKSVKERHESLLEQARKRSKKRG